MKSKVVRPGKLHLPADHQTSTRHSAEETVPGDDYGDCNADFWLSWLVAGVNDE
jgi:hypothetical protein